MAEQAPARNNENPVRVARSRCGSIAGAVVPPERRTAAGPFWYPEPGFFCSANSTKQPRWGNGNDLYGSLNAIDLTA